ncbi:ABC transporter substrate-binding protein [Paenibacillus yanchengensis]|uniref:ABC transporter substrate-binding protein n=1 Tax=Paenibacillus yanchengensis TaxID=2035833 RepID=A0ABW4YNB9_9BACL
MMRKITIAVCSVLLLLVGCSANTDSSKTIRIGYFPNLTHIATIIALEKGFFAEAFGDAYTIQTKVLNNGSLFMEALMTDAIDIGTVGPGPAIVFFEKNPVFRMVAGAANGGTLLMVREASEIITPAQLAGKKVAIPVIGGTQDIMLRQVLEQVPLSPTTSGGNVTLVKASSADMVTLFRQKSIDAAIVQQPWGDYLQSEVNGQVLVDWNQFAWGEEMTNTVVVATDKWIDEGDNITKYLQAHMQALQFIKDYEQEALQLVSDHLQKLSGKVVPEAQLAAAFQKMAVTAELNEQVIAAMAQTSKSAKYIKDSNIDGLIDLSYLNAIIQR